MNTTKISADDPRLTAFALGELTGSEHAAVAAALEHDAAARRTVEEIRAFAGQLESALDGEPLPEVPPAGMPLAPATIAAAPETRPPDGGGIVRGARFRQAYAILGGLAAAGLIMVITLRGPQLRENDRVARSIAEPASSPREAAQAVPTEPPAVNAIAVARQVTEGTKPGLLQQVKDLQAAKQPGGQAETTTLGLPPPATLGMNSPSLFAPAPKALDFAATAPAPQNPAVSLPTQTAAYVKSRPLAKLDAAGIKSVTAPASSGGSAGISPGLRVRTELRDFGGTTGAVTTDFFNALPGGAPQGTLAEPPFVLDRLDVVAEAPGGYTAGASLAGTRIAGRKPAASTEAYAYRRESDFVAADAAPLSTFSADADTASYANVRRFLEQQQLPPVDAVRIEELLNAFTYNYPAPGGRSNDGARRESAERAARPEADTPAPFAASLEVAAAPWSREHRLVRIGLKAREVRPSRRASANLVFLLDVSGSMSDANKLPLVQEAIRLLLTRLRPDDRVAIVTYAGTSGLALPSTAVAQAGEINAAINELRAGGSTNGAMGIQLAYDVARAHFVAGGINRVILCTDGDFNVGTTSEGELVRLIQEKAQTGVFLSVFGFGMGNLKDSMLQQVADAGNGNYGYIDSRREAEKRLVEQVSGALVTVAKDVKLQVEFNPARVRRYRLIGYEKRLLAAQDFKNDRVDAGEIGAGHTVTALYEIEPATGAESSRRGDDETQPQRYVTFSTAPAPRHNDSGVEQELLTVRVRYKLPDGLISRKLEFPLADAGAGFDQASGDFKFASAVAAFGMILRDSAYKGTATLDAVTGWAEAGIGADPGGERAEFVRLVKQAQSLRR